MSRAQVYLVDPHTKSEQRRERRRLARMDSGPGRRNARRVKRERCAIGPVETGYLLTVQ